MSFSSITGKQPTCAANVSVLGFVILFLRARFGNGQTREKGYRWCWRWPLQQLSGGPEGCECIQRWLERRQTSRGEVTWNYSSSCHFLCRAVSVNGERLPSGRFQGVSLELPTYEMATLYKKNDVLDFAIILFMSLHWLPWMCGPLNFLKPCNTIYFHGRPPKTGQWQILLTFYPPATLWQLNFWMCTDTAITSVMILTKVGGGANDKKTRDSDFSNFTCPQI